MRWLASRIRKGSPRFARWYPTAEPGLAAADDQGLNATEFCSIVHSLPSLMFI